MSIQIITGDVRDMLPTIPAKSVQCVVTSPPYYGLRNYGVDGQIGLESTLTAYIETMVDVFRLVRETLADNGVLWLNIGVQVGETFVTLPFGLPLDDMKPIEAKGKNAEWHNLAAAKNALLKMLQEAGGKMDSGTEKIIPSLQVQLLRKSDGVVEGSTDAATNPILAGLVTALSK